MSNVSLLADLYIGMKTTLISMRNIAALVWIFNVLLVEAICMAGAYTGSRRMADLILIELQLEQMNDELIIYHSKSFPDEKVKWFMVIFTILFGAYNVFSNYGLAGIEAVKGYHLLFLSMFYGFNRVLWWTQDVLVVIFMLTTTRVLWTFRLLNDCLQDILQAIYNEYADVSLEWPNNLTVQMKIVSKSNLAVIAHNKNNKINYVIDSLGINEGVIIQRTVPEKIRRLANLYCLLCEMIRNLNKNYGSVLVLLFLGFLVHLVVPIYLSVAEIFYNYKNISRRSNDLKKVAAIINDLGKLFLLVEPCYRTHRQVALTKRLIHKMMEYTSSHDYPLINELKVFSRHIVLNHATYAPLQLFTLDRIFIIAFFGNITTYVIVLLQTNTQ